MPNWCSSSYVIEGDAKEIQSLYKLMKKLQDRNSPAVKNDFGTTWLGCLVDALGKDWNAISCRGSWSCLEMDGEVLKLREFGIRSLCNKPAFVNDVNIQRRFLWQKVVRNESCNQV